MKTRTTNCEYRMQVGLLVALAFLTIVSAAFGRTATPPAGSRVYDTKWLDVNKWKCPFYNDGRYGIDVTVGTGVAGGAWPQPYHNCYIFGAGLWFGSLKQNKNDTAKMDTLVTFGYNPNSGGTEMTPTTTAHKEEGTGSNDDRIYVYPDDWSIPRDRWVTDPSDTIYWDPLVPKENFSLQDMWCAYSDVLPENHISPGKPQGIDVYQTVYAWNYPTNQDIFFIIYHVRNADTATLRNCYMGAVMDADIGDAADDMVGLLDTTRVVPGVGKVANLGFAGDNNNVENAGRDWESGTPGVFAYKFLQSPTGPGGETLGMTAFKKFTIDIDPVTDPAQYLTMAGYDYRTGVLSPFDSVDLAAADKRFIQCSGPFDLMPESVATLVVAAICAPYGGPGQMWNSRPIDSLIHLARIANTAQFIYEKGWLLPCPPLAPNAILVPGDNNVRIVWDDLPERTADPYWEKVARDSSRGRAGGWDPMYLGHDFQGYVVYKSKDGSNWGIIAQFDKIDNVPTDTGADTLRTFPPGGDSTLPDTMWIKMQNTGIRYTLQDNNVTNGFRYYYSVTAYDWNYQTHKDDTTRFDTLVLRSGIVSNLSTVPRWEAVNYDTATLKIVTASGDTVKPSFKLKARVMVPFQVTSDTYELRFLEPLIAGNATALCRYGLRNKKDNSVIIESDTLTYSLSPGRETTAFALPVFNGLAVECTLQTQLPDKPFDTIVNLGGYTGKVIPSGMTNRGKWAFRGSDCEIEWVVDSSTGGVTARVYDLDHRRQEIPFRFFNDADSTRALADGWCFLSAAFKPDSVLAGDIKYLHVCGGLVKLNGEDSVRGKVREIQNGDKWTAVGYKDRGTSPAYNVYYFVSAPNIARADTTYKLNVKVVPNPYIVFNAWEKTSEERVVRFTHLPHDCTIRIFTTNGDLVKVIQHKDKRAGKDPETGADPQDLELGGTETWDFINSSQQLIASGVYVWHVESQVGEQVGKLVFIH